MGDIPGRMGQDDPDKQRKDAIGQTSSQPIERSGTRELKIDPYRLKMFQQQLRDNQNMLMGMFAGFIAASAGAVGWGILTYATNTQYGIVALLVGFLVGFAVRKFGAGYDAKFGVGGAVLALYGCVFGNLIFACMAIAKEYELGFFDVFSKLNFELTWGIMKASFSAMDLFFYGLAIYFGYKYSIRKITQTDLEKLAV